MSDTYDYRVTGMTCGHCVSAVTEELTNIPGVTQVHVDLDAAGASKVTVTADQPVTVESVTAALDAAGDYQLAAHA